MNSKQSQPANVSIRIAKLLSERGICSRREAERWITAGRVKVNGRRIDSPALNVDPAHDKVEVDNIPIPAPEPDLYIALNKPKGYLSSFAKSRENGLLLGNLVKIERRLFTVGRLDLNSRGLLLLTTDGDWANRVMHPRYEKSKAYLVRIRSLPPSLAAKQLSEARFKEEGRWFGVDSAEPEGNWVRVELNEGRNRQIRRVAEQAGLEIRDIVRTRIGTVTLGKLKEGTWRKLTPEEVESFRT
ncbi:pseudouridine synthase [bacterium]|nr:pseudouridine synthase [bacterium]